MVVICEQCGRNFPKPCKLKYHIQTVHLKIKNFQCEYCNELFASSTALKMHHVRKHSDACDYACEDCDRSFKTQSGLDQHYTIHDKGKIFTCLECGQGIKHRTQYKNHLKKHEKDLDTSCKICNKQFADYKKKKEHEYNTHRKNPLIPCPFCSKVIYTQATLEKHLANHPVFKCDICDHTELKKSEFNKHMHDHLRRLKKFCNKKFKIRKSKKSTYLKREVAVMEETPYYLHENSNEEPDPLTFLQIEENPNQDLELKIKEEILDDDDFGNFVMRSHLNGIKVDPDLEEPNLLMDVSEEFCITPSVSNTIENLKSEFLEESCTKCDEIFSNKNLLNAHMIRKHGKNLNDKIYDKFESNEMVCFSCPAHFSDREDMKAHTLKKHGRKCKYDCDSCHFTFVSPQARHQHKVKLHDDRTLKPGRKTCKVCRQKFETILSMKEHFAKVHDGISYDSNDQVVKMEITPDFKQECNNDEETLLKSGKKFNCKNCSSTKSTLDSLMTHVQLKHLDFSRPDRQFCIDCSLMCSSKEELKSHGLLEHHRTYDFDCDLCEFTFSGGQPRSCHKLSAHGVEFDPTYKISSLDYSDDEDSVNQEDFSCKNCPNTFDTLKLLQRHIRVSHLDFSKPDQQFCVYCSLLCSSKEELKSHGREMHRRNHDFDCELCEFTFVDQNSRLNHMIDAHGFENDDLIKLKDSLENSKASSRNKGEFQCKNCDKSFETAVLLRLHIRTRHVDYSRPDRQYCIVCTQMCAGKDALKLHALQEHQKSYDFDCELCEFTFVCRVARTKHKVVQHAFGLELSEEKELINPIYEPKRKKQTDEENNSKSEENVKKRIRKRPSKYPCKVCMQSFRSVADMHRHTAQVHNLKFYGNYSCPKCDLKFEWQNLFTEHFKKEHKEHLHLIQTRELKKPQEILEDPKKIQDHLSRMFCSVCSEMCSSRVEMKQHTLKKHNQKSVIDCEVCWFTFLTQEALRDHLFMVHQQKFKALERKKNRSKEPKIACEFCGKILKNKVVLSHHIAVKHEKVKRFPCDICEEKFLTPSFVRRHVQKVHDDGLKLTRSCGVCNQEFRLAQKFYDHIDTHPGENICRICGENCADEMIFKAHMKNHRKVDDKYKKVVCELCGKKFLNDALLKGHMLSHSDAKTFKCNQCDKTFRFQSSLCIHMNSHNKKIECKICHHKFTSKQGLEIHAVVHNDSRPYSCKLCGKTFRYQGNHSYHMKKHYGTLPEIPCEVCGKTFNSKFFLKSHMILQHEKTKDYSCDGCGEAFAFLKQLQNHMETKCAALRF